MPGDDLVMPGAQGPAELLELTGHVGVAEVLDEISEVVAGGLRGLVVEPAEGLLGVPRHTDLPLRVARLQEAEQLLVALLIETLVAHREQPPRPIERIFLVASMSEGVLLDPAAHVIVAGVRELDQLERVRDLHGVGQRVVERLAIRTRQIQRSPLDAIPPRLVAVLEPARRRLRAAPLDHIDQLRPRGDIDDRGRPRPDDRTPLGRPASPGAAP